MIFLFAFLNIVDFGAIPNDSASDSAAIAACVSQGKDVFFPRGRYILTETIKPQSGTTLFGEAGTELYGIGISDAMLAPNATAQEPQKADITIHDILLRGSSVPRTSGYGIALRNCTRCEVRNVTFQGDLLNSGLYVDACWNNNFYDLVFTGDHERANIEIYRKAGSASSNANQFFGCMTSSSGSPVGVLMSGEAQELGNSNNFFGCTFQNAGGTGMHIERTRATGIYSCYFENCSTAIRLGASYFATSIVITNPEIQRCGRGVWLDRVNRVTITGINPSNTSLPIVLDEAAAVFYVGPAAWMHYGANARQKTGFICIDIDRPDGPPYWPQPGTEVPPGITIGTRNNIFRMTIDNLGAWQSQAILVPSISE